MTTSWRRKGAASTPSIAWKGVRPAHREHHPPYATVFRYYGKLHVYNFGMENLYRLVSYQRRVEGRVLRCPPGDYVIHIPQADGSVLAKKFRACKRYEIPRNPKK